MKDLYDRTIKRHGLLTDHRWAVMMFTSVYILHSLALITHAVIASVELHYLSSDLRTELEVSMDAFNHETLYMFEDLVSGCTLIISVMFFVMVTRNYQVLRDRISKMGAKGPSKTLSLSDRTGFN